MSLVFQVDLPPLVFISNLLDYKNMVAGGVRFCFRYFYLCFFVIGSGSKFSSFFITLIAEFL